MATPALSDPNLRVEEDFFEPEEKWSNGHALDVVRKDFSFSENFLVQNHYQRWNNADRIYLAWTEQKYWEGTKMPRACPSVFLAFEQVESLLPIYMRTLFSDDPWAEAIPRAGTGPEQARIARDFVLSQFRDARGQSALRRAAKSALIYGDGMLEAGWETFTRKRKRHKRTWKQEFKSKVVPMMGRMKVATGDWISTVKSEEVEEEVNRPFIHYVSMRDFYFDPNCQSPNSQDSRFLIKRCWMTVDELDALRDDEEFDIPPIEGMSGLLELAHMKRQTQGDSGKTQSAAWRAEMWQPSLDKTSDAAGLNIEVLNYWTADRLVWTLGTEHVACNRENSYRDSLGDPVKPFFHMFYVDVLDRFLSLGLTDVSEWDQRLIVSLLGGRLDEIALNLNPPRVKRRGLGILSASQLRRRPGGVSTAETPKDDLFQEPVSNVTQQAYIEVQASEVRSQKATGLSDLAVLGTPTPGGNAAARTATGANIQATASNSRTLYLVENAEGECVEPLLDFIHGMDQDYLNPDQMVEFGGPRKQQVMADPLHIKNAVVKFEMRAGSRARSAAKLQQGLPLILQTVLNPEIIQMQAKLGKTPDMTEIDDMIADAFDYKPRGAWWRDMTPAEQQAVNAPPPAPPPDPTKIQMQHERLQIQSANQAQERQAQSDNTDAKSQADILKELIRMTRQDRAAEKSIGSKTGYGS